MSKILIAHRGNLDGPNPEKENHPDYTEIARNQGFHVEIDLWYIDGKFALGHDEPQYEIDRKFLNSRYWIHAKNIDALIALKNGQGHSYLNYFYHQSDDCVLTSRGYVWTYPGQPIISEHQIAVMPEWAKQDYDYSKAGGICTDFIKLTIIKLGLTDYVDY